MEDDTSSTSNVIKGPWKRVKVVSPEETDKLTEDMNFIDEVELLSSEQKSQLIDDKDDWFSKILPDKYFLFQKNISSVL